MLLSQQFIYTEIIVLLYAGHTVAGIEEIIISPIIPCAISQVPMWLPLHPVAIE